jgi:hypothetical protein
MIKSSIAVNLVDAAGFPPDKPFGEKPLTDEYGAIVGFKVPVRFKGDIGEG